jgi:hypothetical protein
LASSRNFFDCWLYAAITLLLMEKKLNHNG